MLTSFFKIQEAEEQSGGSVTQNMEMHQKDVTLDSESYQKDVTLDLDSCQRDVTLESTSTLAHGDEVIKSIFSGYVNSHQFQKNVTDILSTFSSKNKNDVCKRKSLSDE